LQGIKVNVKNIDVGKARAHVSHTVPEDVLSIISGAADPNDAPSCETASFRGRSSSLLSSSGKRDPVEAEVGGHIWSRIQALGISGNVFEEGVEYINDEKEADDATSFSKRKAQLDDKMATHLSYIHAKRAAQTNVHHKDPPSLALESNVWYRPVPQPGRDKLEPR
jgi:hypothetical protein